MTPILIFSDGACSGNPGPGGWGAIIVFPDQKVMELGGFEPHTTNNKMELTGVIRALEAAGQWQDPIHVYMDSIYVIHGITRWVSSWKRNHWKTADGKDVLNRDLWIRLEESTLRRSVLWTHAAGHSGIAGNERCDEIAVAFSRGMAPHLFQGDLKDYPVPVLNLAPKAPKKQASFSYLSLVGNEPMRHSSWSECEKRVRGVPGAKYRKTISSEDERDILASWGFTPADVRKP